MITDKQHRFITEYMIDMEPKLAAIRAGYSANCAAVTAFKLLRKPDIKKEIERLCEESAKRCSVSSDKVVNEYIKIAFSDMSDFAEWSNDDVILTNSHNLSKDNTAVVESITRGKYGVSIKLHSKLAALDALAKHLKLMPSEVNISNTVDINVTEFRESLAERINDIVTRRQKAGTNIKSE